MIEFIKTYRNWILAIVCILILLFGGIAIRNKFFTDGQPIDCTRPGVCPDSEFRP